MQIYSLDPDDGSLELPFLRRIRMHLPRLRTLPSLLFLILQARMVFLTLLRPPMAQRWQTQLQLLLKHRKPRTPRRCLPTQCRVATPVSIAAAANALIAARESCLDMSLPVSTHCLSIEDAKDAVKVLVDHALPLAKHCANVASEDYIPRGSCLEGPPLGGRKV